MLFVTLLVACSGAAPAPDPVPVDPAGPVAAPAGVPVGVHVDRAARTITVTLADGATVVEPIGIGRGGLGVKGSMADEITPTGTFTVDLVLHAAGTRNAVAPEVVARFADDPGYAALLSSPAGLGALFANMDALDFDGDGRGGEYGAAYVGLHAHDAVTGPKMHRYRGTARWFSIALHGTPTPDTDLGAADSGGCVHVSEDLLTRAIDTGVLAIGRVVTIADGPPPRGRP